MDELEHELLSGTQIRRRVVVVRAFRAEADVDEVRIDPGNGRERAGRRVLEEALRPQKLLPVEVRGNAEIAERVQRVDEPQHRYDVVCVPAPGDVRGIEVADERVQVVERRVD